MLSAFMRTKAESSVLHSRYKRSGAFDRLRREVLQAFQDSVSEACDHLLLSLTLIKKNLRADFIQRVEGIASSALLSDRNVSYRSKDDIHSNLTKELNRYAKYLETR